MSLPALFSVAALLVPAHAGASACKAAPSEPTNVAGILVEDQRAAMGDLPWLRVTHAESGAWMSVYYDPASEVAARSRASCLGTQLVLLREALGDERRDVRWASAVFTSGDYTPPRDGADVRWIVKTSAEGSLTPETDDMVSRVMPHEQTHQFQIRSGSGLPRWFEEGHATWLGLKVTEQIRPDLAEADRARHAAALSASASPAALGAWGGVGVRPEALRRQSPPAEQAKMDADPRYVPPGPFRFQSSDFVSDESNTSNRYAAALQIFLDLERRHGAAGIRDWAAELTEAPGNVTSDAITGNAKVRFDEDLRSRLR